MIYIQNGWIFKFIFTYKKKGAEAPLSKNGASDGIGLEPYCIEFLHLCLHDKDTIEQIRKFLSGYKYL